MVTETAVYPVTHCAHTDPKNKLFFFGATSFIYLTINLFHVTWRWDVLIMRIRQRYLQCQEWIFFIFLFGICLMMSLLTLLHIKRGGASGWFWPQPLLINWQPLPAPRHSWPSAVAPPLSVQNSSDWFGCSFKLRIHTIQWGTPPPNTTTTLWANTSLSNPSITHCNRPLPSLLNRLKKYQALLWHNLRRLLPPPVFFSFFFYLLASSRWHRYS